MITLGKVLEIPGEKVPICLEESVRWYRKAAEPGSPSAQETLADCLEKGRGCQKNPEEAAMWRQKAKDAGDARA